MKEDSHHILRDINGHLINALGQLIFDPDCAEGRTQERERSRITQEKKQ